MIHFFATYAFFWITRSYLRSIDFSSKVVPHLIDHQALTEPLHGGVVTEDSKADDVVVLETLPSIAVDPGGNVLASLKACSRSNSFSSWKNLYIGCPKRMFQCPIKVLKSG